MLIISNSESKQKQVIVDVDLFRNLLKVNIQWLKKEFSPDDWAKLEEIGLWQTDMINELEKALK